jgi:DNA-3-methyladenine glycosylase II
MAGLIERHGPCALTAARERDFFGSLALSIVSQQLSTKAAAEIARRLLETVPEFDAKMLAKTDDVVLRTAGLSGSKARYVRNLAFAVISGSLDLEVLPKLSDEDVVGSLTSISGIAPWTAQMFLIFSLKRPNVLSPGDGGLRRAALSLYGIELEEVSENWRPFRSVASWYLWRHLDG